METSAGTDMKGVSGTGLNDENEYHRENLQPSNSREICSTLAKSLNLRSQGVKVCYEIAAPRNTFKTYAGKCKSTVHIGLFLNLGILTFIPLT